MILTAFPIPQVLYVPQTVCPIIRIDFLYILVLYEFLYSQNHSQEQDVKKANGEKKTLDAQGCKPIP